MSQTPLLDEAIAVLETEDPASVLALADVAHERVRQIKGEGWSLEHDDQHKDGELSAAAGVYATMGCPRLNEYAKCLVGGLPPMMSWPWAPSWYKPRSPHRNRIRAAALLVADLARHLRSASSTDGSCG